MGVCKNAQEGVRQACIQGSRLLHHPLTDPETHIAESGLNGTQVRWGNDLRSWVQAGWEGKNMRTAGPGRKWAIRMGIRDSMGTGRCIL